MPISPVTSFIASSVASRTDLITNSQLVDAYLRGKIDAGDFVDKLKGDVGVRGSNYRVWAESWDSGAYYVPDHAIAPPDSIRLDHDAHLDFTHFTDPADQPTLLATPLGGSPISVIYSWKSLLGDYTWEKLGVTPIRSSDGYELKTNPNSWQNWLYNAPVPNPLPVDLSTGWINIGEYQSQFPRSEYWDRWLTVHKAAKRIYIPEPCLLFVTGAAIGTFNHNVNPEINGLGTSPSEWHTGWKTGAISECPAVFQLFIDHDGTPGRRFTWTSNGDEFTADWSPITPKNVAGIREVGYSGSPIRVMRGLEWSFSCAPRATARVASYIEVEQAGWYNISMRYNSRYWHGMYDAATATYNPSMLALMDPPAILIGLWAPGPIRYARWEETGLSILAQFKRTGATDHYQQGDYAP